MNRIIDLLNEPLAKVGGATITAGHVLAAVALVLALAVGLAVRRARARRIEAEARDAENAARIAELLKAQSEMQGRMATIADVFGARQAELNQSIQQRLDGMTSRIGQTMTEQTKATHENLSKLQERLAVIDTAQTNIQSLASQVVELQSILSNKQTRGAFGQARMETIIADALPHGAYQFQTTLSNNSRPDCVIFMPNDSPSLVIDAKFPLESWNAIREAGDDAKAARQRFRRDIEVHISDIAQKYLITGETQDTAFMFVPSESIFAEIHENFEALVQKAHRSRIVIVSPSLLMLSVQVIQAVLKDARMREQAHLIQGEVARLMEDLGRLDDRVRKLQTHFGQATRDIEMIVTSTDKLGKRGRRIEELEFGEAPEAGHKSAHVEKVADETAGRLRLRVVDED